MSKLMAESGTDAAAFAERFAAGWAAGGPADRFVDHFAPLCAPDLLLIQPLSPPLRGIEGLRSMARQLFEAMPDLRGEVLRWGPTHDGLIIELTLRGTLGRRPLEWTVADRIVLRDGLMVERRSYFDPTPLLPAMMRSPRASLRTLRGNAKAKGARMTDKVTWRDPALGTPRDLDLPQGRLRCFEAGSGPPIVFVHGLLVNANLWRKVIAKLSPGFHCVALDLPLGAHNLPMPEATDLSPPALAELIADAIEELGLDDVTLVGNDTGGALCQMVAASKPERVGRLVLTSCDYRDHFPPPLFAYFKPAARIPGAFQALLAPMRLRAPRRLPIAFGWLTKRPIDRAAEDSYLYPAMRDPAARADLRKVLNGADKRQTNAAADKLGNFTKPALIAWSAEDKVFPRSDAERLAADLPAARLELVEGARTFSAEDQPERLAELIARFVREPVSGPQSTTTP